MSEHVADADGVELDVDLLVLGAGMAGLTAASWAAESGLVVLVAEKASHIGGSAVLSGGGQWAAADVETLRRVNPLGDPDLAEVVVSGWQELADWIEHVGAEVGDRSSQEGSEGTFGFSTISRRFDPLDYVRRCEALVVSSGGHVVTGVMPLELLVKDGAVAGARIEDRDGIATIRAGSTLLATGGFQGDRALRRELIGEHAADLLLRANPHSTGDGLRLGRSVGASLTRHLDGWYGHTVPYPLPNGLHPKDFIRFAQFGLSPHALLLDRAGRRFIDESEGYYLNAQAVSRLRPSRALLVFDEAAHAADLNRKSSAAQADRPREAAAEGAHVVESSDWSTIAAAAESWGYRDVESAVWAFNDAMANDRRSVDPGRRRHRRALDHPPYFAMEVQPAITFTHGGLRIDRRAQVLNDTGAPIHGLLAAGVDGAGTFHQAYAGGLNMSGTLGIAAAKTAMAAASGTTNALPLRKSEQKAHV